MTKVKSPALPDLTPYFDRINLRHFEGLLEPIELKWNRRLSKASGRFFPLRKRMGYRLEPSIELASFLTLRPDFELQIENTLGHEMIHYWLWLRGQPYGHTAEFIRKMQQMGVSRYNRVHPERVARYRYSCPVCEAGVDSSKILKGNIACSQCCAKHSAGRYDPRFKMIRVKIAGKSKPSRTGVC
jgi:predicted SprT family Zn-dependent metalloprotease